MPSGFEPASVTFVSPDLGYVLGTTTSCASPPCTSVVRTTDGGQHWIGVPAPRTVLSVGSASGAYPGVSRIRFADPFNGFAYGPSLYVTHDGAKSWRSLPVPARIIGLSISAGRVTFLESPCTSNASCGGTVELLTGPATGNSFTRVTEARVSQTLAQQPLVMHGNAGFAVLGPGQFGPSIVDATADGRTWRSFPDPCAAAAGTSLADFAAPDTTYLFSLCIGEPAGGTASKRVMMTRNGKTELAGTLAGGNNNAAITAASDQVLVAALFGVRGELVRSTDAGHTWQPVNYFQDGGAPFIDLAFTTPAQGVAVHGLPRNPASGAPLMPDELIMTNDAGESWHRIDF